jgi:glycosyltransferase involved in cell wall biosynthesis
MTTEQREIQDWINEVKNADIVVGIPSFNNARTIGHVVRAVQAGLAKYFPGSKAVLVNSDGGSTDRTMDIVRSEVIEDLSSILVTHPTGAFFRLALPYHGLPGKGSAFKTIFEIADNLDARACAVVDSDLRSITPEWIELLIKPVLSGNFDYVAPLYHRHKFDGTITNSIIYPLTRALYGKQIRQPIGGDFGFSGDLARLYLSKDVWNSDVARYGIDIWMTTTAIAANCRICQAFLGAKIHDPKDPGADLSAMLFQVVGSALELMETYPDVWMTVRGSTPVPVFGFQYAVGLEPVAVNLERMKERFSLGVRELMGIWEQFLTPDVTVYLKELSEPRHSFHMPDEIWVKIIYSFAIAAHRQSMSKEHLLKSLTPLYIGRTASFVQQNLNSDAKEVEDKIEALCNVFEREKGLIVKNWE